MKYVIFKDESIFLICSYSGQDINEECIVVADNFQLMKDDKYLNKGEILASLSYVDKRTVEYNKLNQFEMMFDDMQNDTSTWQETIESIKEKYPKSE